MATPVLKGRKSRAEKFAGALQSFSIEAMMQNGYALQAGTSHDLGQNFGKAFDVKFQNQQNELDYVWQTSWGVSTRLIGSIIMTHSDDSGLVLPPKLAQIQAVIVPIWKTDDEKATVLERAQQLATELRAKDLAVEVDVREGMTPGAKYFHWERRGVCVRLELGPQDIAKGQTMLKRRDGGDKLALPLTAVAEELPKILDQMQVGLHEKARKFRDDNTVDASSFQEVGEILGKATAEKGGGKFVRAYLKDDPANDAKLKELKLSTRNFPQGDDAPPGTCILTGEPVTERVVIAKAY
jgi:prolyl-tRNA synthetase